MHSRASGFRVPLEDTYYCYHLRASSLSAGADAPGPSASLFPFPKKKKKNPKALTAKHNQQRKGREHVENHSGTLSTFLPSSILSSTACYPPPHPPVFLYTLCTLSPLFLSLYQMFTSFVLSTLSCSTALYLSA